MISKKSKKLIFRVLDFAYKLLLLPFKHNGRRLVHNLNGRKGYKLFFLMNILVRIGLIQVIVALLVIYSDSLGSVDLIFSVSLCSILIITSAIHLFRYFSGENIFVNGNAVLEVDDSLSKLIMLYFVGISAN